MSVDILYELFLEYLKFKIIFFIFTNFVELIEVKFFYIDKYLMCVFYGLGIVLGV